MWPHNSVTTFKACFLLSFQQKIHLIKKKKKKKKKTTRPVALLIIITLNYDPGPLFNVVACLTIQIAVQIKAT